MRNSPFWRFLFFIFVFVLGFLILFFGCPVQPESFDSRLGLGRTGVELLLLGGGVGSRSVCFNLGWELTPPPLPYWRRTVMVCSIHVVFIEGHMQASACTPSPALDLSYYSQIRFCSVDLSGALDRTNPPIYSLQDISAKTSTKLPIREVTGEWPHHMLTSSTAPRIVSSQPSSVSFPVISHAQ